MAGLDPAIHVVPATLLGRGGSSRPSTPSFEVAARTWIPGSADKFTQSAQGRLLWPGVTREAIISLLDLARVHLDRGIQQFRRKRALHRERLFHAEIGLHQFVILFHPLGVDPAECFRRGEVV